MFFPVFQASKVHRQLVKNLDFYSFVTSLSLKTDEPTVPCNKQIKKFKK